jgi:transposase
MTSIIKKKKGNKEYYYAVKSERVNGKPRITWQKYLGTVDAIIKKFEESSTPTPVETTLFNAGGVAALFQIASRINLMEIINEVVPKRDQGPSVGHYILLAAFNRVLDPLSKSQIGEWYRNTSLHRLWNFPEENFNPQRFWDHMGMISKDHIDEIQRRIVEKMKKEFNIEIGNMLYDVTNFFTYIDTHNQRNTIAKRGKNKQKRSDLLQVNLALLTTKDFNIPLFHQAYNGNITDVTFFPEVARNLLDKNKAVSGNIEKSTLIFDKGNLSENNREQLLHSGIHFVGGEKSTLFPDLFETPIEQFKESIIPGTKYISSSVEISLKNCIAVVSYSDSFFTEQLSSITTTLNKCARKLRDLQTEVSGWHQGQKKQGKRPTVQSIETKIKEILSPQYMKDLFHITVEPINDIPSLKYSINQNELDRLTKTRLGRTLLVSNRNNWSPEEIITSYRGLSNIEEAFKHMKNRDYLRWQPAFHWTDQKIEVHTFYCVLALLLATLTRKVVVEAGLDISLHTLLDELSEIKEVALLYKSEKGLQATLTVNSMTPRQKKIAEILKIIEVLGEG